MADLVDQFMRYTEGIRSAPLFRRWCAITMIGGAMERRICAISGSDTNYANLIVMLIGPPGAGKKVINIVRDLWAATGNTLGVPAFYVGANDSTKAAVFDALRDARQIHPPTGYAYHNLLLPVEEFSNSFAKFDPELLNLLTSIYDAPPRYVERRRKSGEIIIPNPIVTGLLGYQPVLLDKILMKGVGEQGFLRRTILIWNETAAHILPFNTTSLNEPYAKQIISRLGEISGIAGQMEFCREAQLFINDWYDTGCPPRPLNEELKYYLHSRPQFLIKLSMIASMSESTDMEVKLSHAERALNWLIDAENIMPKIFEYMPGDSERAIINRFYEYCLKQQSSGFRVTDKMIMEWLEDRVAIMKINYVIKHLVAKGTLIRRSDGTWLVTARPPT